MCGTTPKSRARHFVACCFVMFSWYANADDTSERVERALSLRSEGQWSELARDLSKPSSRRGSEVLEVLFVEARLHLVAEGATQPSFVESDARRLKNKLDREAAMGFLESRKNNWLRAASHFRNASRLDPTNVPVVTNWSECLVAFATSNPNKYAKNATYASLDKELVDRLQTLAIARGTGEVLLGRVWFPADDVEEVKTQILELSALRSRESELEAGIRDFEVRLAVAQQQKSEAEAAEHARTIRALSKELVEAKSKITRLEKEIPTNVWTGKCEIVPLTLPATSPSRGEAPADAAGG